MTRKLVTVSPLSAVSSAAKLMKEKNIGCLLVTRGDKLLGMVTEGDIVGRIVVAGKDPKKTKVSDIMTSELISISPGDDLHKVHDLMNKHGLKRLPVLDNNKLVGLLTEKDLIRVNPGIMDVLSEKLKIKEPKFKLGYSIIR